MPWRNLLLPSHQLALLDAVINEAGGTAHALHLHLDVAAAWGLDRYQAWYQRLRHVPLAQEALYAGLLFPDRRARIGTALGTYGLAPDDPGFWDDWERAHDAAFSRYDWQGFDAVIVWSHGVVSAPTTQYLAGLEAARRLRRAAPAVPILLAGPAYAGDLGASLLPVVPWVDGVLDGEPESAVAEFVRSGSASPRRLPGVRWQPETGIPTQPPRPVDLAGLPIPDYRSFFAHPLAQDLAEPLLRVETARGCWWDRSDRDPRLSCQFCNINLATPGYRRKPVDAVVAEIASLAAVYPTRRFGFTDTITWPQDAADLFAAIADRDLGLAFHGLEAHVSLGRQALWHMQRAGVCSVQFGVEALSPDLLKRMGKGIRPERIVEALRTCAELGIGVKANLILDYPGADAADVAVTLDRLADLTWLPPLDLSVATIGYGSPLYRRGDDAIAAMAPAPVYRELLPEAWSTALTLMHVSYEPAVPMPDWEPVRAFVEWWQERWRSSPVALRRYYIDRPDARPDDLALLSFDEHGTASLGWLGGQERRLFLFCLEGRSRERIADVFGTDAWIEAALSSWSRSGHLSDRDGVVLSLGVAGDDDAKGRLSRILAEAPTASRPPAPPVRLRLRPNTGRP